MLRLTLLFLILIVYGSLYPFTEWTPARTPLFAFLLQWPVHIPRADLVQNVLAYAPFGLFLGLYRLRRPGARAAAALRWTVEAGFLLSLTMECLQQFEPVRTASTADIAMNVLGSAAGAVLALILAATPLPPAWSAARHPGLLIARLHDWRQRCFYGGTLPNLGLAAVALWVLSQTSPLVPAFDLAYLGHKLVVLAWQLRAAAHAALAPLLVVAAQLVALGLLMRTVLRPRPEQRYGDGVFAAMLALVFAVKLLMVGRYLVLSDVAGAAIALAVLAVLQRDRRSGRRRAALAGSVLLVAGFIVGESLVGDGGGLHPFNWVPLSGQMRSLTGLENILELFWPFFALAYFVRWLTAAGRRFQVMMLGALLVLALVFQLEWMQQALPGRYGDITQVLLAVCGWLLPWSFRSADFQRAARRASAAVTPVAIP
ncbi:VanZ family protein [Massilia sp. PWRC2]|uniref:VanZ family protein n=1 Tax=Massilia sp. PWRC2 TaxID=2804626 RepID=UPI003CE9ABDA